MIKQTSEIKPDIVYEVFIHKVDSDMFMSDDQKIECLNVIQTNMRGLLQEFKTPISLAFQLTSIYDHTIYEALSKVIQKLLPQVSFISSMMDTLISKKKVKADTEVLKLYHAFVESMKYGFAARSHLGDLYKNGMKNVTEKVCNLLSYIYKIKAGLFN